MVHSLLVALSTIIAASAASTAQPELTQGVGAPPAPPEARYCLWVEPQTGSRLESVECWTREEWAEADVDVDKDWAKEGVKVIA
jgi:hypothetical protein